MSKNIEDYSDLVDYIHSKESGVFDDKGNLTLFGFIVLIFIGVALGYVVVKLKISSKK